MFTNMTLALAFVIFFGGRADIPKLNEGEATYIGRRVNLSKGMALSRGKNGAGRNCLRLQDIRKKTWQLIDYSHQTVFWLRDLRV